MSKLYNGYVKVGFGNYITPYFEGYINNKRDKQYSYGAHVKHLSSRNGPIEDDMSGNSENTVDLFANAYGRNAVMGGKLLYSGKNYNYYGFPTGAVVDKDTINHDFDIIKFSTDFSSSDVSNDFQYNMKFAVDHISDNYSAKETEIKVDAESAYQISKESSAYLGFNVSSVNQSDLSFSSHSRILVTGSPEYHFVYNSINIRAGANFTYSNDTLGHMAKFRIYPNLEARYQISSSTNVYGGLTGETQRNTYQKLSTQNPYLGLNAIVFDSNKQLVIHGGLESSIGQNMIAKAGFSYALVKNMYYFNNGIDQAKFDVLYDLGNTTVTSLFASINYSSPRGLTMLLMGELNQYSTDQIAEVWHRPQFKMRFNSKYNLFNKVLIGADLNVMSGIKAENGNGGSVETLDPAIDLSFNLDYRFSDRFSAFIKLKNVISNEYEYYQFYPVRGFQVLAGVTYTF